MPEARGGTRRKEESPRGEHSRPAKLKMSEKEKEETLAPNSCQRDLPGMFSVLLPYPLPGQFLRGYYPGARTREKFRRCKREKMQLRRTPPPHAPPHSPTPGGGDLGHPEGPYARRRGCPRGFPGS